MQEDDEGGPAGEAFRLIHDKSLLSQVLTMSWCPTMDLIALATADKQVSVYRASPDWWQRLWSISADEIVTQICWRPDGKALAVGSQNGSVQVLEVETGETMSRISEHSCAIAHLHWQAELEDTDGPGDGSFSRQYGSEYADRSAIFFPPPPVPTPPPGSAAAAAMYDTQAMEGSNKPGTTEWPLTLGAVSTLCSCDEDGNISLHALGSYCVGRLSLCSELQFRTQKDRVDREVKLCDVHVCSAVFSPHLSRLSLVVKGRATDESDHSEGVFCVVLDTRLFHSRREEIRRLAMQALHIKSLMLCVDSGIEAINMRWEEAIRGFTSKLHTLTQELQRNGSSFSPREELLNLLICGILSNTLHDFICMNLTENKMKKMSKQFEHSLQAVQGLLIEQLQPCAEMLTFHLGELDGLTQWKSQFHTLGLDREQVKLAVEAAQGLMVHVESLQRLTAYLSTNYKSLFGWLASVSHQLTSDGGRRGDAEEEGSFNSANTLGLAAFLEEELLKDSLQEFIGKNTTAGATVEETEMETEGSTPNKQSFRARSSRSHGPLSMWNQEEIVRREAMATLLEEIGLCPAQRQTLQGQIELLQDRCTKAFGGTAKAISPKIRCEQLLPLYCRAGLLAKSSWHLQCSCLPATSAAREEYIAFCMPGEEAEGSAAAGVCTIGVIRMGAVQPEHAPIQIEAASINLPPGTHPVDLDFYTDGQLAMLVKDSAEGTEGPRSARLALYSCDTLPFVQLRGGKSPRSAHIARSDGQQIAIDALAGGDVLDLCSLAPCAEVRLDGSDEAVRLRKIEHLDVGSPLSVGSRGVASVIAAQKRLLLFDLWEDEEADEEG
mmetsp:Transcript_11403/g.41726  ORF Transcript_11403/g.41726 Transcript_11403/m.41726 type:complete len:834 (+) Transcript_11403:72-2573(+)